MLEQLGTHLLDCYVLNESDPA